MRTTLTLDKDVYMSIQKKIRETGKSAKELTNELLRSALSYQAPSKKDTSDRRFAPPIFHGKKGLLPGFHWDMGFADMADRLDEAAWQESNL